MEPVSDAWENDYCCRGRLWGGVPHNLPDLPQRSRVLELGCGNGKSLFAMLLRGWDVTAFDFATRAVMLSRKVLGDASCGDVMVADARSPPFKADSFDAVFALHVIGHMREKDRKQIAHKLHHILKPGGILYFAEFAADDFRFGKGDEPEPATFRRGSGIITHYFTHEEVNDLFSHFTLSSISTRQWPMRVLGNILVRSEIHATFNR